MKGRKSYSSNTGATRLALPSFGTGHTEDQDKHVRINANQSSANNGGSTKAAENGDNQVVEDDGWDVEEDGMLDEEWEVREGEQNGKNAVQVVLVAAGKEETLGLESPLALAGEEEPAALTHDMGAGTALPVGETTQVREHGTGLAGQQQPTTTAQEGVSAQVQDDGNFAEVKMVGTIMDAAPCVVPTQGEKTGDVSAAASSVPLGPLRG